MKRPSVLLFLVFLLVSAGCEPPPYKEARYIMGTLCEVTVWGERDGEARAAAGKAFDALKRVDELMSSYKETSEISRINREGFARPVSVSDETFFVLERALEIAQASGGAFDPTVGPLVKLWGFFDKEGFRVPSEGEIAAVRPRCGWEKVVLEPRQKTVRLLAEGMELDLGGIAKGYAADLALTALRREGVRCAKVDLGGQLGFLGLPAPGKKWEVAIEDPINPGAVAQTIEAGEEGVATSANTQNFFDAGGKRYGHLLDPRTGRPAESKILSVTVVAPSGIEADALATAIFVLGAEKGNELARRRGVRAVLIEGEFD